jgi:hypothetical protein
VSPTRLAIIPLQPDELYRVFHGSEDHLGLPQLTIPNDSNYINRKASYTTTTDPREVLL